jgi:Putative prokaryotic signal transducing protein
MSTNSPDDEIVRLAIAESVPEAYAWRQALQDEGISCRVVGEYLGGGIGMVPAGNIGPEIWVHQSDEDRAREVLKTWLDKKP